MNQQTKNRDRAQRGRRNTARFTNEKPDIRGVLVVAKGADQVQVKNGLLKQ